MAESMPSIGAVWQGFPSRSREGLGGGGRVTSVRDIPSPDPSRKREGSYAQPEEIRH